MPAPEDASLAHVARTGHKLPSETRRTKEIPLQACLQRTYVPRTRYTGCSMARGTSPRRLAESAPLARCLPAAMSVARTADDMGLLTWIRLELLGYVSDNPAMTEAT